MIRRPTRGLLAAAALAWAAVACHPRPGDAAPPWGPVVLGDTVELSAFAPAAVLIVDVEQISGAAVAEVHLVRVENPAGDAFSLRVRLAWGADGSAAFRGEGVVLGTVGTYPVQAGGRFVLDVADEVRRARAAVRASSAETGLLVLELVPIAADRPLSDALRVRVAPVVWRAGS
ncbi:MAG TPA: hypothetical protein VFT45_04780 [Longimicrobium sp.]|nr:hypothetical protein [Longimicrobium sp.]